MSSRSAARDVSKSIAPLCMVIFAAAIILQKFCVPGLPLLPLATGFLPLIAVAALIDGRLQFDFRTFTAYLVFCGCAALSMALSISTEVSLLSLLLVIVMLFPMTLTARNHDPSVRQRVLEFAGNFLLIVAIMGILQVVLQSVLPRSLLFFIDQNLPEGVLIQGYNNLNPLFYNSPYIKANGVFLAEPSHFSQFMAIAIIIEITQRMRLWRLAILLGAMAASYSGTGILLLAIWGMYFAVVQGQLVTVIAVGSAVVVGALLFGDLIGLDIILARSTEFSDPGSSGFARFVSMFYILDEVIFPDMLSTLFGRGSGTVTEYFWRFTFESFGPTWGKLFYEYGLIGSLAYAYFYLSSVLGRGALVLPVSLLYFLLGGYFIDASIIVVIVTLVTWLPPQEQSQEAPRTDSIRRPTPQTA
jgi:hypothetical protein